MAIGKFCKQQTKSYASSFIGKRFGNSLDSKVKQLIEKKYETETLKQVINDILRFGAVLGDKRVWIRKI